MKYEQIRKKFFPPETNTYDKELLISDGVHLLDLFFVLIIVIIIIIGLIKYLAWFMPIKPPIPVDKQDNIDHLASQFPLFIV